MIVAYYHLAKTLLRKLILNYNTTNGLKSIGQVVNSILRILLTGTQKKKNLSYNEYSYKSNHPLVKQLIRIDMKIIVVCREVKVHLKIN